MEKGPRTLGPAYGARWGRWTGLDEMFERIDIERGFRVIIRAEEIDTGSSFAGRVENELPLMAARKGIFSEIGPFPDL